MLITPIADEFCAADLVRCSFHWGNFPSGWNDACRIPRWRQEIPRHAEGSGAAKNHPTMWSVEFDEKSPIPADFRTKSMPSYGAEPLRGR